MNRKLKMRHYRLSLSSSFVAFAWPFASPQSLPRMDLVDKVEIDSDAERCIQLLACSVEHARANRKVQIFPARQIMGVSD